MAGAGEQRVVNDEAAKITETETGNLLSNEQNSQVDVADWEADLAGQPQLQKVENWQHFLAIKVEHETGMNVQWRNGFGDHQHMSKALTGAGKLEYLQYYIATDLSIVHGVFFFTGDMVSFPGVLHGGSQFFAYDETCGQLAFLLLPGGCVTVHAEIVFKKVVSKFAMAIVKLEFPRVETVDVFSTCTLEKPFPAGQQKAIVTAQVEKIEGKKAFIRGTLRDSPDGTIYSEIKMTYVKMPENIRRLSSLNLQRQSSANLQRQFSLDLQRQSSVDLKRQPSLDLQRQSSLTRQRQNSKL